MGPIEEELRAKADIICSSWPTFERMSTGSKKVCWDAARSLKRHFSFFSHRRDRAEVLSEAIEAADRLGL
jgi:hypothetical protein